MPEILHAEPAASVVSHDLDGPPAADAAHLDLAKVQAMAVLPAGPTVSIYLPTHRVRREQPEDHTRCHHLLHDARVQLVQALGGPRAAVILEPAFTAIENNAFWTHAHAGLALFCREDDFRFLWLPAAVTEQVVLSNHHHLKPLFPLLAGGGQFYLLALSQHGIRLFLGSRFGMQVVPLTDPPADIDEALGAMEYDRHTAVRTIHGAGEGAGQHSSTVGDKRPKERISRYFHLIDRYVAGILHGSVAPLIIAGVDYLLPLYRAESTYPHLLASGIGRNSVGLALNELHDLCWAIVGPHFLQGEVEAQRRYADLAGGSRATDDLAGVLTATCQGRVEDLFLAGDVERWGRYDAGEERIHTFAVRQPIDDDLLNLALIAGLQTKARIHVSPQDDLPGRREIAAILRY